MNECDAMRRLGAEVEVEGEDVSSCRVPVELFTLDTYQRLHAAREML